MRELIGWIEWFISLTILFFTTKGTRTVIREGKDPGSRFSLGAIAWLWIVLIVATFTSNRIHLFWFLPLAYTIIWFMIYLTSRTFVGEVLMIPAQILFKIKHNESRSEKIKERIEELILKEATEMKQDIELDRLLLEYFRSHSDLFALLDYTNCGMSARFFFGQYNYITEALNLNENQIKKLIEDHPFFFFFNDNYPNGYSVTMRISMLIFRIKFSGFDLKDEKLLLGEERFRKNFN
jgi:hypothetical protein